MMPSILSQFISTIKETTRYYVICRSELTFAANQINNQLLTKPFEVFFLLAISYFGVCWTLTQVANHLERRIAARRADLGMPANLGWLRAAAIAVEPETVQEIRP